MDRLTLEAIAQQSVDSRRELEQEMLAKERLKNVQNGALIASHGGPTPEQYNYEMAARDIDFSESPDGGIDLPNRFVNYPQPVAGFDMQTGDQLFDFPDPLKLGRTGIEEIRNGVVNTVHGPDVRTLDGALKVAYSARQAGLPFSEVGLPFDREGSAVIEATVSSLDYLDTVVRQLEQVPMVAPSELPPLPEPERPPVTRQSLQQDARWNEATRRMWDFYSDDPYPGDEKATNAMVQQLAMITMNEVEMAHLFLSMRRGEMDQETAQSLLYALEMYDEISMFDSHVWLGGGAGLATSPLTYLSGFVGRAAYMAANRKGAMVALRSGLQRYLSEGSVAVAMGAGAGGLAGAATGGAFLAGEEAVRQQAAVIAGEQEQISAGAVVGMGAVGSVAGLLLGGGIGGLLASNIPGGIGRVIQRGYDQVTGKAKYGTPVKESPETMLENRFVSIMRGDELPEAINMGVPIEEGFYSRLNVAMSRNIDNTYPGAAELDPTDLLNRLDPSAPPEKSQRTPADRYRGSWLRGSEATDIPPVSQYEIDSMGLRDLLQDRANRGEKISRLELDAFMYARSPDMNIGVTYSEFPISPSGDRTPPPDTMMVKEYDPQHLASAIAATSVVQRIGNKVKIDFTKEDLLKSFNIPETRGSSIQYKFTWQDPITQEPRSYVNSLWADTPDAEGPFVRERMDFIHKEIISHDIQVALQDMDTGALIRLANELDEKFLLAERAPNVRWEDMSLAGREDEYGSFIPPNNYQEMRLFIPAKSKDVNNIAADRFGTPYDQLSDTDRQWVDYASQYTLDSGTFQENTHFPMDLNRLAHIRTEDITVFITDPKTGRRTDKKILFVDEMQSDMRSSVTRHAPEKKIDEAARKKSYDKFLGIVRSELDDTRAEDIQSIIEQNGGLKGVTLKQLDNMMAGLRRDVAIASRNVLSEQTPYEVYQQKMKPFNAAYNDMVADWEVTGLGAYQPMTGGWREAALAQIFHRAGKEGYDGVAFPSHISQIEKIQHWRRGSGGQHASAKIYTDWLPRQLKRRSMQQRLGISKIAEGVAIAEPDPMTGSMDIQRLSDEPVTTYLIDPKKARASTDNMKPLFGVAGPLGALQLLGQDDGETPDTP